jgi:hypothetical protein
VFAEIVTPAATLAFGSTESVALFKEGSAEPASNRTAILEFQVDGEWNVCGGRRRKIVVRMASESTL